MKELIRRIEAHDHVGGTLYPHKTPLPAGVHPELDDTPLLGPEATRTYQMLIGSAQWASLLGCLDITFAVASLSRFSARPREGHLELALHLMGYLKKHPNRRIVIDSRPLIIDDVGTDKPTFEPDFLEDYPDAKEEIDSNLPKAFGKALDTSCFFDADFAHDTATRRSITGLLLFVGSTPVVSSSRRQGCIATSTYCAEFVSMRSAVEEVKSLRYMLRCLGVPVETPTNLFGDNFGVIQSASIPHSELKKKHVAVSYHAVREAIAAKYINTYWIDSTENFADLMTKALGGNLFTSHVHDLMA